MWHVLHLIVRPIEALIGLFCALTAILLYPTDEGKIQSKLEDFWVKLDDYQRVAISRHTAFMQLIARLESSWLDRVFGHKLLSARSLAASVCLSIASAGFVLDVYMLTHDNADVLQAVYRFLLFAVFIFVPCLILAVLPSLLPGHRFRRTADTLTILGVVPIFLFMYGRNSPIFFALLLVSIASDFVFIGFTRRLLQFAADIKHTANIASVIALNCLLAILLCILPFWAYETARIKMRTVSVHINLKLVPLEEIQILAASNAIDAFLAFLFALLASLLLVHWLLWPLLTRTLFKMADIGTKGRRAILTTVGIALLGTSVFGGKFPELLAKVIEKFGG